MKKNKKLENEIDSTKSKKGILVFDLSDPYEKDDFELALNAVNYKIALEDISNKIFRPARKHGYANPKIAELVDKNENAEELIGELEKLFWEILEDNGVKLF